MSKRQYLKDIIDMLTEQYCNGEIDLKGLSTQSIKRIVEIDIFTGFNPFNLKFNDIHKPIILMYLNEIINSKDKRYVKLWVGTGKKIQQKYAIYVNRNIVKKSTKNLYGERKTKKQLEYEERLRLIKEEKIRINRIVTKKQLEIVYNDYFY